MTTEHPIGDNDQLVSKTYRELTTEHTPEHLNQTVLRMAAKGAGRGGAGRFLSAGWMKPVAWAATIGLSLAIVLELTQVPMEDIPRAETPMATPPAAEVVGEAFIAKEKQALGRAQEQARQQSGDLQREAREDEFLQDTISPVLENKAMRRPAAATPQPTQEPAQYSRQESAVALEEVVAEDADRLHIQAKREIVDDQAAARKRSADQALAGTGEARDNAAFEGDTALAASATFVESDADSACDLQARSSADDWLACIEDLRVSGATEQADLEYEAYILEFPAETDPN